MASTSTDHDPGDEDRSTLNDMACPFCGEEMRGRGIHRPWATPIVPPQPFEFSDVAARIPSSLDKLSCEVIHTCAGCADKARRFASEQRRTPAGEIRPVTVRLLPSVATPKYQTHWSEDEARVFMSMNTDEVLVRLFAYYVIAPPGDDTRQAEENAP